jgi:hypothetical protein
MRRDSATRRGAKGEHGAPGSPSLSPCGRDNALASRGLYIKIAVHVPASIGLTGDEKPPPIQRILFTSVPPCPSLCARAVHTGCFPAQESPLPLPPPFHQRSPSSPSTPQTTRCVSSSGTSTGEYRASAAPGGNQHTERRVVLGGRPHHLDTTVANEDEMAAQLADLPSDFPHLLDPAKFQRGE